MTSQDMAAPGVALEGTARFGDTTAFGPISARFDGGRWTSLLGRSGCGKTTLLRAIAGLLGEAFEGRVDAADGVPIAGRVAWMAQRDLLAPWASARENIALGAHLRGEAIDPARIETALAAVGLTGKADAAPDALSGGQRQRVALARTLLEDRPIVLLDEPFSALDAITRAEVQALFQRALTGRTVIHVTHDPEEAARLTDRIAVMTPTALRWVDGAAAAAALTPSEVDIARQATALRRSLKAAEREGAA